MRAGFIARLRRLERARGVRAEPAGVLIVPAGIGMSDPEVHRLIEERRERTGWQEAMVLLPANQRGVAP